MEQLEALQLVAIDAVNALNARGDVLEARLQDVPTHVREVALHGIRHEAAVALMIAQVRSGHDLCLLEPGFPDGEDPDIYQELVDDFEGATEAVVHITPVEGIVNHVFFGF